MKRTWAPEELIDHWTLLPAERALIEEANTESNQLGCALLLKWFQYEGRFPHAPLEVPAPVVAFLAQQLGVSPEVWRNYPWHSRTMERQRALIRQRCGVREATVRDSDELVAWLLDQVLPHQRQREALTTALYERCRAMHTEPPASKRIERLIGSALHTADERLYSATLARLAPETCAKLDVLLTVSPVADDEAASVPTRSGDSAWQALKSDPGPVGLESFLTELAKLAQLRALELPKDLFAQVSPKILESYRQRVAVEELHEVRRHPAPVRYTLLAAYCWLRSQEITDTLVDVLIDLIHRIGARAEQHVDRVLLTDLKRVRGKTGLLYAVAEAALEHPEGIVREVLFPVAGEQTLRDLVKEFHATGSYDQQVHTKMRSAYGSYYRRLVPPLLGALVFRSNNAVHRPVIRALALLQRYVDSDQSY